MIREVWCLCHQSDLGWHRGLEGTLHKFLKGFFILSARRKVRFLNEGSDTCIVKEQSMPVRTGEHIPSWTVYVREKLYVDLVSMSGTVRGNQYLLRAEDSSVDTVIHIQSQTRKHWPWPRYWWIDKSTFMGYQSSCTQIMAKSSLTICGENCSQSWRYSILQYHHIIRLLTL